MNSKNEPESNVRASCPPGVDTFRAKQARCLRPIMRTGCSRSLWTAGFQPALWAADFQSALGLCPPGGQEARATFHTLALIVLLLLSTLLDAGSIQQTLNENLSRTRGAVLITNVHNGAVLGVIQPELFSKQYPPGSLIKVFTVIAYYKEHGDAFPVLSCPPTLSSDSQGCWDRNGHGKVGITDALAHSCNVYFRQIAHQLSPELFLSTLKEFELIDETTGYSDETIRKMMVGSTLEWSTDPTRILRAYCALFNNGYLYPLYAGASKYIKIEEEAKQIIHRGLIKSSEEGTSMEARRITGRPLLGKTGTSWLWNNGSVSWRNTQGWWIGLYPADKPEIAVLAFAPNGRGATDAAPLGASALSLLIKELY